MFASVGADGSVRMFDLRHLEHSTIIYEVRRRCLFVNYIDKNTLFRALLSNPVTTRFLSGTHRIFSLFKDLS